MAAPASNAAARKRAAHEDEQNLPAAEELKALAAGVASIAASRRHERAFSFLRSLAAAPPRAVLIEGGTAAERAVTALFWAMTLNCAQAGTAEGGRQTPCFSCSVCLQFLAQMHRDFFFFDGRSGSIGIDDVRAVRGTLGEAPREAAFRVVVFSEAQHLTEAAANAMLKSLEEAPPATTFVLTAPQRERLLPTLVSRSWVVTLAWPDPLAAGEGTDGEEKNWAGIAANFLASGKGLFEKTGARGGVDAHGANALVIACQRALAQALAGYTAADVAPGQSAGADLARFFASLPEQRRGIAASVLEEGQESVAAQVNPGLVVDWVMTRLYLLRPGRPW